MPSLTMTPTEAAIELGVRVEEVYRLIRCRRLLATRAGRKWMLNREAVMARAVKKRERDNGNK